MVIRLLALVTMLSHRYHSQNFWAYIPINTFVKRPLNPYFQKSQKAFEILLLTADSLPQAKLIQLYYSKIYPYLSYCNITWVSNCATRLNCLTMLQKRAMHTIGKRSPHASSELTFASLGILTLDCLTKLQINVFVYRYTN